LEGREGFRALTKLGLNLFVLPRGRLEGREGFRALTKLGLNLFALQRQGREGGKEGIMRRKRGGTLNPKP
jgi:hypothetical protein